MTLLQLQYFQVLARVLHYTRAAEELHISQPSLSYSISELEKELGVKLFEKENRKISLTAYGEQFLPYVQRSLALLDEGAAVTTSRNDIDYVVTEYGVAALKGRTLRQRARALIEIAHPDFRDGLKAEYEKRFHCKY